MLANLVYGLVDPRTLLVRYVGLSSTGVKRPNQHRDTRELAKTCHKSSWIKSLLTAGLNYTIVVLEEVTSKDALSEAERFWIAYGRACGWPLTNANTGGSGMVGGHHTAETRAKMSAAHKGKKFSAEHRAKLAIVARKKRAPQSPEHRAKNAAARRGKKRSVEAIAKTAASLRGYKHTSEARANMRAARLRYLADAG